MTNVPHSQCLCLDIIFIHVHLNITRIGSLAIVFNCFFYLIHCRYATKLEQNRCFSVHIHILEFNNVMTNYGALNMCESVYIHSNITFNGLVKV